MLKQESNGVTTKFISAKYQIEFDQQYADYLSKISTSISAIEKMKDEIAKLVLFICFFFYNNMMLQKLKIETKNT